MRSHGIVSETIEGEAVVLNLATGTYFSLSGAAVLAWSALQDGAGAAQLIALLKSRYRSEGAAVEDAVSAFLDNLLLEEVIEPVRDTVPVACPPGEGGSELFRGLTIQRFTDIQELLLIDPVHEVDERGWPARPENG